MHSSTLRFRKSSYSGSGDNCVEIADVAGGAAVRDTQHRDLGNLTFADPGEWRAFLAAARRDSF
ncbi:DUF397 domain-containing protein [Nocardiopsis sp. NRRL B-16309]|uniref:DUF397 domain-containing protein n=1 Tax=Nocardiopsis sp. NRRL B-16309 TaxID=1519494 RepID=UPI0006AE1450|nr:DUF397 domain-containing protein [Nocardiopsis sp. NRRL B-16309]KOX16699.1 hypothetical protein ADL05_11520 [Nocardiopsis sp. NRRL B-16309]